MANSERPGFIVYHETLDETDYMTDTQRGQLFRALMCYSRSGEIVEDIDPIVMGAFMCMRKSIDRQAANYERTCERNRINGSKGGRPKKTEKTQWVVSEPTETQNNPNYNSSSSSNENKNINQKQESEGAKAQAPSPPRGIYENVYLSDEDYATLGAEFGDIDARIDRLSEYMAASGKSYVNHMAILRQWAREDGAKSRDEKPTVSPTRPGCAANEISPAGEHEIAAVRRLQEMRRQREATGYDELSSDGGGQNML